MDLGSLSSPRIIWNYFLASSCRALSVKKYPSRSNRRRSNGPTLVSGILVYPFSTFVCTCTYIHRNFHLYILPLIVQSCRRHRRSHAPFQVQLILPESLNTRMNIERTFIFICDLEIWQQSRSRWMISSKPPYIVYM